MTESRSTLCGVVVLISCGCLIALQERVAAGPPAEEVSAAILRIQEVSGQAEGHVAARQAIQTLQSQDASALLPILQALETANPLSANWLRNAFETIAARTVKQGQPLPVDEMFAFLGEKSHNPKSRRLTFEWLRRVAGERTNSLIPGFLNDPSDELRREAVARLLEEASAIPATEASAQSRRRELYQQALTGASDDDQVRKIVAALKEYDISVDLPRHYGLLTDWYLIGPFDNKNESGFPVVYPPEQQVDLAGEYAGQLGPVTWQQYSTDDSYGTMDLAKLVGPHKGAILYACTDFPSETAQPVEFRLATPNAWKLWLNGELLFEREEYHRGTFFDQYRVPAKLKPGKNQILLKICQNEQEQSWAQDWKIQFRVCNPFGMAVSQPEQAE
ncbi:MAG: hypothetical protein R3C12_11385 [Planctomycetaceae bacterium]|nr:hypothetical protein [Planctomycetaceae bacterium]